MWRFEVSIVGHNITVMSVLCKCDTFARRVVTRRKYYFLGRHFDKVGNMVDWWTEESAEAFVNRTQCLVEQYNKYRIGDGDHVSIQ